MFQRCKNQQGVALITVLVIAALVSIMAVSMISDQQLDIRRTGNLIDSEQAYVLARGVEDWARQVLIRDQQGGSTDNLGEAWAQGLMPTEAEGGVVSGYLEDMQGRININNLVAAAPAGVAGFTYTQLERLFERCHVAPEALDNLVDWLDSNQQTTFLGMEDDLYLVLDTPYRAANREMVSPTELLQVAGITEEMYRTCLAPDIAALPSGTYLNVNTAPAGVIATLIPDLTEAQAMEIVDQRPEKGYKNVADFAALPAFAGKGLDVNFLDVKSNFFLGHVRVEIGNGRIMLYSLMDRNRTPPGVLLRSIGVY